MDSTKKPQISILFFLISFTNVLGLLYSAALPNLSEYFQITKDQAQLTIAFYLLGYSLGLLFYGPLANSFGRKYALYIGVTLALIGSLLCIVSIEIPSLTLLYFGRIITAFGASSGLVLTFIIVGDAFTHAEAKKKLSYLLGGFSLFPALSIALGGFLTEFLSWKSCFFFMLFYCLFVTGLTIFLPETGKDKNLHHLKLQTIIKEYSKQGSHFLFLLCTLIIAGAGIIIYFFSAEAPFIAIKLLKISASSYGLYNIIPFLGMFLGGVTSAYFSHKFSAKKIILIAILQFIFFSFIMLGLFEFGIINIFSLFVLPFLIFFSAPAILANSIALALVVSKDHAYASSLMNSIQIFVIFLTFLLLFIFPSEKAIVLPLAYSISGLWMAAIWLVMRTVHIDVQR